MANNRFQPTVLALRARLAAEPGVRHQWEVGVNPQYVCLRMALATAFLTISPNSSSANPGELTVLTLEGKLSNFSEVSQKDTEVDFSILILTKAVSIPSPNGHLSFPSGSVVAIPMPEEMHVRWYPDFRGKHAKVVCEYLPGHYMPEIIASCYAREIAVDA